MRIDSYLNVGRVQGVKPSSLGRVEGARETALDSVQLSQRAEDLRAAREALAAIPEIREAKVDELRTQMEQGTFDPALDDLANKLFPPGT